MVTESTRARRPGYQTVSSHMSIVQTEALSAIGGGHDGDRMVRNGADLLPKRPCARIFVRLG